MKSGGCRPPPGFEPAVATSTKDDKGKLSSTGNETGGVKGEGWQSGEDTVFVGNGKSVFDEPTSQEYYERDFESFFPGANSAKGNLLSSDGTAGYGGCEYNIKVLDRNSAPKTKKYKWNYLWSYLPRELLCKIQMDEVATFSVTDMRTAERMTEELLNLEGITEMSKITDCTACVGGNTLSFARAFRHVNAVELDPMRCAMLRNNLSICIRHAHVQICDGCGNMTVTCKCDQETATYRSSVSSSEYANSEKQDEEGEQDVQLRPIIGTVSIFEGDCLKVCASLQQDILFVDPPWGGKRYSSRETIELFLSSRSLDEVCGELSKFAKYLALKVPHNADLEKTLQCEGCTLIKIVELGKMKMIVLEYSKSLSEDQLNFLSQWL